MNVEQPRIMNRPKCVNTQAARFLSRWRKYLKQRVGNRLLFTGTRMKPAEEEHLHAVSTSRSLRNLCNLCNLPAHRHHSGRDRSPSPGLTGEGVGGEGL